MGNGASFAWVLDHENLTYRHGGRDLRLTDVHGRGLDAHSCLGSRALPPGQLNRLQFAEVTAEFDERAGLVLQPCSQIVVE